LLRNPTSPRTAGRGKNGISFSRREFARELRRDGRGNAALRGGSDEAIQRGARIGSPVKQSRCPSGLRRLLAMTNGKNEREKRTEKKKGSGTPTNAV
jgi:hypothetical protein